MADVLDQRRGVAGGRLAGGVLWRVTQQELEATSRSWPCLADTQRSGRLTASVRVSTKPGQLEAGSIVPVRMFLRQLRYPLRALLGCGLRAPYGAPHRASTSARISASANVRTIMPRSKSASAVTGCLRNQARGSIAERAT